MYEENLIEKFRENPKVLHAYIRKKKVGRPTVGPLTLANGELSDDAKQMSESLADAFSSVYTSTTPSSPPPTRSLMGLWTSSVLQRIRLGPHFPRLMNTLQWVQMESTP